MSAKNIAIIPARGGSKRIPNKNIKIFAGKPAIEYAIMSAVDSNLFADIIVSTDSKLIAEIAESIWPVKIIDRPPELSDDHTTTVPVIAHAINEYLVHSNIDSLNVCCIYPVNPFLSPQDIIKGLEILDSSPTISYVNPICSYPYPPQRAVRKDNSIIEMVNPQLALTRSQDLEDYYHDAGQWYWGKSNSWLSGKNLLENSKALHIPRWRCQDIDTSEDWEFAEYLYELIKNKA